MEALKKCKLKLSYILAELFNMCVKESCFPDCWKVLAVVPVFKNIGERSTAKTYRPVSLLSVFSKVFEKLVYNRLVNHLEKCGLFSDFQYGYRSSRSSADLVTVVPDRIARIFNRSETTRAVVYDTFSSVIDGFMWFWMGIFRKNIQTVLEFLKGPFVVLYLSCLH